jgi:tRNA1(Val) A37 N6-methylase TrmN6
VEVIHDLLNFKNLKIVQNNKWFNFSLDSVLLPNFISLPKKCDRILDLGTGNAPIPLILSTKTKANIYGVEIQKEIYNLAKKTIMLNKLDNCITIMNEDIKEIDKLFESDYFDAITCNPPYFKVFDKSKFNQNDLKTIARHEILVNLEDIMKVSRKLLKNNGVLAIVHRPDRLLEVLEIMKKYNIEPKRLRFVYPKTNSECNIVLIEGKKNGKAGLKILSPLYVHKSNGEYTEEVKSMFN